MVEHIQQVLDHEGGELTDVLVPMEGVASRVDPLEVVLSQVDPLEGVVSRVETQHEVENIPLAKLGVRDRLLQILVEGCGLHP